MYCSSPSESETIKGFLLTLTVFDSHVRPLSCAVTQSCSDWAAHTDRNQLTGDIISRCSLTAAVISFDMVHHHLLQTPAVADTSSERSKAPGGVWPREQIPI